MTRCLGCMAEYDEKYEVCPHCGYIEGTPAKEAYHLEPGTVLHEKYIVGKVLGNGGFGVTYIGWDTVLETKVAIKEYFPGEFSTRVAGETAVSVFSGDRAEQFHSGMVKFIEEAQRLAKFNKTKGVVHVYDYFEENCTAYIIMEYLDGESYKDKMKKYGPVSVEEARDVIIAVLDALKEVHEEGIIHRDIAPDNIMRTRSGEIVLLDFGASRFATTKHSKSLSVILKPGYAPEEQYRSRGDQGPWTDMYATAATFYKMITGITPQASIERSARDLVKRPSKLGVKIPKNLENAIMNALNIRIEARTQNATEFLAALNAEKVKRKKEKIKAADIGKWPLWIKILAPLALAGVATFIALMATGVISFSMLTSRNGGLKDGQVYMPSIVNMTYSEAEEKLAESNLFINIKEKEYSNDVPENRVLKQSIAEGEVVDINTTVEVTVSAGVEIFYVPSVTDTADGVFTDDMETMLNNSHMKWHVTGVAGELIPGTILSQSIKPGTEVTDDMDMEILVSQGLPTITSGLNAKMIDVVGQKFDEARQNLKENNFYVIKNEEFHNDVPYLYVLNQSVAPETDVTTGIAVSITVNMTEAKINIPDIKGQVFEEIEESLKEKYFEVSSEEIYDASIASGNVVRTEPEIGTLVDVGDAVKIFVSKGPEPVTKKPSSSSGNSYYNNNRQTYYSSQVTVPNIVGLSKTEASGLLDSVGLYLSYRWVVEDYGNDIGIIEDQSPAAGDVVSRGSEITYRICVGPEYVSMPNLVGMWCWTAYCTCLDNGLRSNYYSSTDETVISYQSVEPGTTVHNGTYIYIY